MLIDGQTLMFSLIPTFSPTDAHVESMDAALMTAAGHFLQLTVLRGAERVILSDKNESRAMAAEDAQEVIDLFCGPAPLFATYIDHDHLVGTSMTSSIAEAYTALLQLCGGRGVHPRWPAAALDLAQVLTQLGIKDHLDLSAIRALKEATSALGVVSALVRVGHFINMQVRSCELAPA
jgi:hypothetical protein